MSNIEIQNLRIGHPDIAIVLGSAQTVYKPGPDPVGGVTVFFDFKNLSNKTIKYITFSFIPYNAVGDAVSCSARYESERSVRFTGPLNPQETNKGTYFENAWYNNTIVKVVVSKVKIEYTDGSEETIEGSDISITNTSSGGCYIATAVYGSYDCPQVWTLRRYRDYTLAETWYGRAFIHTYYAISPKLVKWFGHSDWFKKIWKDILDGMVSNLNEEGIENTPYEDRNW